MAEHQRPAVDADRGPVVTCDDATTDTTRLPAGRLLGPALAALQWARLAAWLLELHEGTRAPRIALERAELGTDLRPAPAYVAGELGALDALRAQWFAVDGAETARVIALDAVRRALHAALDCLDALDGAERESGVRETITLVFRAWRFYANDTSPVMAGVIDGAARMLAPLVVLGATPRASDDVFNGGPLP